MPERDGYLPGVPCWIDTSQPDPEAAVEFYSGLFGWEFEDVMPPESEGKYFIARLRGGDVAAVGSIPEGAPPMALWNTYIWVESADEIAAKVLAAGGNALMEPFDVMDAGRMAVFADPEGAAFCVWQAKEHKGARIVNEHGSLNFNGLNTRDVEGAKAFYGSVFGWETLELGPALAPERRPLHQYLHEFVGLGLLPPLRRVDDAGGHRADPGADGPHPDGLGLREPLDAPLGPRVRHARVFDRRAEGVVDAVEEPRVER